MNFLNKLQRRFGRYAIHNLMMYIIILNAVGFMMYLVNPQMLAYICWNWDAILHGQIWRLVTFIMMPFDRSIISFLLFAFVYYSIGQALERAWGTFRQNIYIFSGLIGHILGAIIVYYAFGHVNVTSLNTYYLNMSMFLALAMTFPDTQFLLYFIIPIKAKYMAMVSGAFLIFEFAVGSVATRVMIAMSLINFLLYAVFLFRQNSAGFNPRQTAKKMEFKRAAREASARPVHKCAVCGRTDKDYPELEFRYCSRCAGAYEYCMDHLYTHVHVTASGDQPKS